MADPTITAQLAQAARLRPPTRLLGWGIPQVWVRFLLAIVGLTLAFGTALFSSVTRESGSLWSTLILASVALGLALIVGLTTVPYLARQVAGERVRDAFDYEVTRVGIIYVIAVLVIGIAALNTGNNLLYVIVSAMLGAIVVSGLASAVVLRGLQLDVRLPEEVFAGRAALARIVVRNRRRWMPSFSFSVIPLHKDKSARRWTWEPATFAFPPGYPPDKQWLRLPDRRLRRDPSPSQKLFAQPRDREAHNHRLPPSRESWAGYHWGERRSAHAHSAPTSIQKARRRRQALGPSLRVSPNSRLPRVGAMIRNLDRMMMPRGLHALAFATIRAS